MPQEQILRSLKAHGFFSSADDILKILSVSSSISPYFKSLLKQFPNVEIILNDFLFSKEILTSLKKLPDAPENDPSHKSRKKHSAFCSEIAGDEFKEFDFIRHRPAGEMLAFFWLTHTCIHCMPGITVSRHLTNLLHASLAFVQSVNILIEDNSSFCKSWSATLESDLDKWIAEASSAVGQALGSQMQKAAVKDIEQGFKDACQLIRNIRVPPSFQDTKALDEEDDNNDGQDDKSNPKIRVSEKRGAGLEERERLKCHFNSFQEHEIKSLSKTIRNVIERDIESQDATSTEFVIYPPYFHEASLIALALATARSIEGTIKFPLSPNSREYIANEVISKMPWSIYPIWHRIFSVECHIRIPLPSFLKEPISLLFSYESAETIEDCLPYSLIDWSERCTDWLAGNIQWTRRYINRRVRDCLPRELYHETANSALLYLFASPISDAHLSNESLSHYINLLGERTLEAYQTACQRIFNKYGAPSNLVKLYSRDDYATSKEQHIAVAEHFLERIAAAEKANDYIEYHNWIARYILMLMIVATGHRKSRDPFYFSWDILEEEDLAFLCDKLTVGSEARFVPIPEWLSSLILEYRSHLLALSDKLLDRAPQLSRKIRHLACGGDLMALPSSQADAPNTNQHANSLGFFFTLNDSYQARTISTANLEQSYFSVYSGKIGEFRKSVANALWEYGCSGYQVETYLGHNGENHSFGESSSWSIAGWASGIRSWQEQYLETRGWKTIKLSTASAKYLKQASFETPLVKPGNKDSYERRARDRQQAVAAAIKVIRENLPASWFDDDEKSNITDADFRELKSIVEAKLGSDPVACSQVNQALAQEIGRIRNCVGKVSSTIANLTRTEPSPIPVSASRHYRIASQVRSWWANELGRYSIDQAGAIKRLAEIGISLIIFDALLDKNTWECILDEIACHETRMDHGCLFVRDKIERRHEIYEKSLVLSPVTAALIMGYEQKFVSHKPDKSFAKEVKKAVNLLLKSAPKATRSETLELANLIDVFKSWWIIRLPGALYSIAIGDHAGPAADAMTECALFEIPYGSIAPASESNTPKAARSSIKSDHDEAWDVLSKFIGSSKGRIEDKNASTRYQRRQLARSLCNSGTALYAKLSEIAQNQQIVYLMLEFLVFLLEEGGEIKKVLRYSAIRTYVSNISDLIKVLWDRNVLDFASEDFDEAYKKAIEIIKQNKSINYGTPLSLFHKFLRSTYDVPESRVVCRLNRGKTLCRASLVTVAQFENAWSKIDSHVEDDGQIIHHSMNFLYLMDVHGTRPKEAFGMRAWHILAIKPMVIRVARNAARDLKTQNSLRASYSLLANPDHEKHFNQSVELSGISPTTNQFLFEDTESQGQLYSSWKIGQAVTMVLRMKTGNPGVVPYSLRHSVATRLAHWVFKPPRAIPLSQHIVNTMKGSLQEDAIFSLFEQGFAAWPFWPDRIGMHLGQAGSDTLLGTYWHSSNVRLAEYTWHACEEITFTDVQFANMLGRERSAITHQRKRLLSDLADAPKINICEKLIVHYASRSGIPSIGEEFASSIPSVSKVRKKDEVSAEIDSSIWVAYDRLLCDRLLHQLSLSQTAEKAASMGIAQRKMAKFVESYKGIVSQTGFADFEPENSEILNDSAKGKKGALKGAIERERGVTAAHKLVKSDEGFAKSLREFVALWVSRVDSKYPWFIARNEGELQLVLDVLAKVGVNKSQIEIRCCNFEVSRLSKMLSTEQMASVVTQNQRLSQGPKNIRISEIGIQVIQEANSKIGDNRDTHRLALILAAISMAELDANIAHKPS